MEDLKPGVLLELVVGNRGDRINVVSYIGDDEDGLLSVERCKFDERERTFLPISFGDRGYDRRLLQGLKRRALRPSPPSELTHPAQILPGQLIEARRPFGYSVCVVHTVLDDGTVQVRHRNEHIQKIHRRNLRNHLKFRRHAKDWVVRSVVSSGLVEEESKRQKACS